MSLEIKLLKTWLEGKIEFTEYRLSEIDEWDNKFVHNFYRGRLEALKEVLEEIK